MKLIHVDRLTPEQRRELAAAAREARPTRKLGRNSANCSRKGRRRRSNEYEKDEKDERIAPALRWPETQKLSARPQHCNPYAGFHSRHKRLPPILDTTAMGRPRMDQMPVRLEGRPLRVENPLRRQRTCTVVEIRNQKTPQRRPHLGLRLRRLPRLRHTQEKRCAYLVVDPISFPFVHRLAIALAALLFVLRSLEALALRAKPFFTLPAIKDRIWNSIWKRVRAHSEAPRLPTHRNAVDIQRTGNPSLAPRGDKLVLPPGPCCVIYFALTTPLPHRFDLGARINPLTRRRPGGSL